MNNRVSTIQTELQRLFLLTYKELKNKQVQDIVRINYPHIYDYIKYTIKNPVIFQLLHEESERRFNHTLWGLTYKRKKIGRPSEDTDIALNQWYNYKNLYDYIYEKIDWFNDDGKLSDANLWGIAFMTPPLDILSSHISLKYKIKLILLKIKRGEHKYQMDVKNKLYGVHHRLLNLLTEYDARPECDKKPKELNSSLIQLGFKPDSKWQDLIIEFKGEFEVKIKHKDNDLLLTHEHLGFADNRTPNQTKAKSSWDLLRLLAVGNGVFPIDKLRGKDKAKRKKQKQELSKLLKRYFQIKDDPFYEVNKDKSEYKIKIKLIPEKEFRDDWKDKDIWDDKKNKSLLVDI